MASCHLSHPTALGLHALLDTHIHYVQLLPSNADASLPTHYHPLAQGSVLRLPFARTLQIAAASKRLGITFYDAECGSVQSHCIQLHRTTKFASAHSRIQLTASMCSWIPIANRQTRNSHSKSSRCLQLKLFMNERPLSTRIAQAASQKIGCLNRQPGHEHSFRSKTSRGHTHLNSCKRHESSCY